MQREFVIESERGTVYRGTDNLFKNCTSENKSKAKWKCKKLIGENCNFLLPSLFLSKKGKVGVTNDKNLWKKRIIQKESVGG